MKSSRLTLGLCLALVIKTIRGFAQEDSVAYRHEFYREDHHRMNVDTDSVAFDVGLGTHARLTGEFVIDSISGATPTGAPPQSKWPFPTFNDFYNQAHTQLFLSAVNDPNNLILFQSGYFSNNFKAYTNYVAVNNPQIRTQATNNAIASYRSLTNSPSFHNSTQVPLAQLNDLRGAFSLAAPLTFGIHQITPEFSYSEESDYISYGGALNYAILLNKKNTTLNLGLSHNSDSVRDDKFVWENKTTDNVLLGVNQLLTPKSYLTVNLTYGNESGYLSDPYRGVMPLLNFPQTNPEDAALIPEKRPRHRNLEILYASYNHFIDPLEGSVELDYRFFHDSYGIFAQTVELDWHQKIGRYLVFTPGFRYYYQTAADFYYILVPDFNSLPTFYSADYRLSQLQTISASATLTYRVQKHLSLDFSYMRYIMQGLDGMTSQSAYPSANVFTVGGRVWF